MAPVTQTLCTMNFQEAEYSDDAAIHALYCELAKGIESKNNDEVYTIDEAWAEINRI